MEILKLDAFGPVSGATRCVGDGDDLYIVAAFAEDHGARITVQDCAAGTAQIWRAHAWCLLYNAIGCSQFRIELQCNGMALFPKPVECGVRFRLSFRV